MTQPPNTTAPAAKALIHKILLGTGFLFFACGFAFVIRPGALDGFLDAEMARIFGGALLMVGVSDMALAHFMFRPRDEFRNHHDKTDKFNH